MNEPEEIEEERRLCYVGLTRAKDRLTLSWALHRRVHGYGVGEPSRFLREMPEDRLLPLNAGRAMETAAAPMAAREVPRYEPEEESWPIRVGARVRHARFGDGLVVGVERDGGDTIVTVGFASVGRKRLSLQYAQLEQLS
jgi:DNA helicase-2/ATP-dependent DNA helicase PcrA